MSEFWYCFVPLFVAVDAIGVLPMFMGLTSSVPHRQLRPIVAKSAATALLVAVAFIVSGKAVLAYLGITIEDFMIAGGVLLFVLSMSDLLAFEKRQRHVEAEDLGPVPLGVPLIVGPAVLTTALLLVDQYGLAMTLAATVANVALAAAAFMASGAIHRLIGSTGAKIVSKLASLLLAAIAVMMVRKGIVAVASGL